MTPLKIFNHKDFLKNYSSKSQSAVLLKEILYKNTNEKLDLFSAKFLKVLEQTFFNYTIGNHKVIADLEFIPFALKSFDLILSHGSLMLTNDVPGVLKQWFASLKPGGVFIGTFFGNETLRELKNSFFEASELLNLPHYNRFLPMISTKDAGALMYRAGFTNPASDLTREEFFANDIFQIFKILRAMGGNHVYEHNKAHHLSRKFIEKVASIYERDYSCTKGLKVTVDVICVTGWAVAISSAQKIQQNKLKLIGNV